MKIFTTLVRGMVRVDDLQTDSTVVLLPNQQAILVGTRIDGRGKPRRLLLD